MDPITYTDVKAECCELDDYLQQRNKDKLGLVKEISESLQRCKVASFTDFLREKMPHTEVMESFLPSPSSDEVSDLVSNDDDEEKRKVEKGFYSTVLYDKIESLLIDSKTLVESATGDDCKNLMLQGIPETLDYFDFVKFKDTLRKHPPNFYAVHFCFFESRYSLVLEFEDSTGAQRFFESCKKRELPNFKNYLGDRFDLKWVENCAKVANERKETLERRLYDTAFGASKKPKSLVFYSADFVGVVLRNVPSNYDCGEIVSLLGEKNVKAELSQICKFSNEIFVLLQFGSIEEAELAVFFLHLKVISGHEMKASIHRKSNYFRRPDKQRYFKDIFVHREYNEDKINSVLEVLQTKSSKETRDQVDEDVPESPHAKLARSQQLRQARKSSEREGRDSHSDRNVIDRYREDRRFEHRRPQHNNDYHNRYNNRGYGDRRPYDRGFKPRHYRKEENSHQHYRRERQRSISRSDHQDHREHKRSHVEGARQKEQLDSSLSLSSSRSREKHTRRDTSRGYNRGRPDHHDNQHNRRGNDSFHRSRQHDNAHRSRDN